MAATVQGPNYPPPPPFSLPPPLIPAACSLTNTYLVRDEYHFDLVTGTYLVRDE